MEMPVADFGAQGLSGIHMLVAGKHVLPAGVPQYRVGSLGLPLVLLLGSPGLNWGPWVALG